MQLLVCVCCRMLSMLLDDAALRDADTRVVAS